MTPQTTEKVTVSEQYYRDTFETASTETAETDTGTETQETAETDTETAVSVVNTRIHTVFVNTETVKTVENTRIFKHVDEKTGEVQEMGESEVKRRVRVYTDRVLETKNKIKDLEIKGDTAMVEKQKLVLENRETGKQYWETALNQITDGNSTETEETDGNSNVLRIAA